MLMCVRSTRCEPTKRWLIHKCSIQLRKKGLQIKRNAEYGMGEADGNQFVEISLLFLINLLLQHVLTLSRKRIFGFFWESLEDFFRGQSRFSFLPMKTMSTTNNDYELKQANRNQAFTPVIFLMIKHKRCGEHTKSVCASDRYTHKMTRNKNNTKKTDWMEFHRKYSHADVALLLYKWFLF